MKCLRNAVETYCFENTDLRGETLNFISQCLTEFVMTSAAKYAAGQREHGGNLWERDSIHAEMDKEIIDLFFYSCALHVQERRIAKPQNVIDLQYDPGADIYSVPPDVK